MAVSFTTTIGTTDYGFDWVNEVIEVEAAVADSSAADLKEAIHDAQDGTEGMSFDPIANFGNSVTLTDTASTFLNVILLSTWKILSLSGSGTFTVGDGNVVHITDGIDIFASNTNVTYVNNTSAAGVLVTGGGSAVLPGDITDIKNAVWEKTLEGAFTAEEIMLIMSSALAGKASGLDANAPVYRDISDTKDRITATTDSDGNRTAVTVDGT